MFSKMLLVLLIIFALSGCKKQDSYDYLMSHPSYLKRELLRCRDTEQGFCAVINKAGHDFSDLIEARVRNPQAFGQQILALQEQLAAAKMTVDELQKNPRVNDKALLAARESLQRLCQQVRVMIAVVRETSGALG